MSKHNVFFDEISLRFEERRVSVDEAGTFAERGAPVPSDGITMAFCHSRVVYGLPMPGQRYFITEGLKADRQVCVSPRVLATQLALS